MCATNLIQEYPYVKVGVFLYLDTKSHPRYMRRVDSLTLAQTNRLAYHNPLLVVSCLVLVTRKGRGVEYITLWTIIVL